MTYIIEISNLNKQFGNQKVFENFNLKIEDGKMVAIHGNSGKGKSTLLNIIGTIEEFDSGEVTVLNHKNVKPNSYRSQKLLRYDIAYLFQNYALIDSMSVVDNLKIAQRYSKEKGIEMIPGVLKNVGLEGFESKKIYSLSGGEQQRVALARVMLKPCKLVLADEPTGNVDEENKGLILELFKSLNEQGKTIVIVTHDHSIDSYFDEIIDL